jgi:hypothetical protein
MPRVPRRRLPTASARRRAAAILCLAITGWWTATASAQLDPLLFVKRVPPTVIIVMDTSLRMLEDGNGHFYDPLDYAAANDSAVATAMGVVGAVNYRRIYTNLQYENVVDTNTKFEAETITGVGDNTAAYSTFYDNTRFGIAKAGIEQAVSENAGSAYRWGLIKLRQASPSWRTSGNCDKPVRVTANAALELLSDSNPCNVGGSGRYGVYTTTVSSGTPNYSIETLYGGGAQVVTPAAATASSILTIVRKPIGDNTGLIPASAGSRTNGDRPITHALEDARAAAIAAMNADSAANRTCRNTVVVLITGGEDDGPASYTSGHNPVTTAATFLSVAASDGTTKRVPIHVLAVRPASSHETELQSIASSSGGRYVNVASAAEVAKNINYAVQNGFARSTEFDAGSSSEFVPVSPIVGTVNLKNADDINGTDLPNTDISAIPGGQALPQRSNFLLTAGFSLPGFDGTLRAFRVYRPEEDDTKPTGWKFVNDGTQLWPDLDGRPSLAGKARVPADPNARNIYTYIPDGSGGGSVVAFTTANEATLRSHMNISGSAANTITFVRSQALGAVIGSTPAIMDVPSLDPPPDDDYGYADGTGFAATYKDRRALIYFGGNNGMVHAVDARTGYEVWAFIPYNLLPKLRTLVDGQPIEQFDYFVDSSPKLAEVKINGDWRSLLLIGQGPGGTFYQAFDVTEAGMGVSPDQGDASAVAALLQRFDTPNESIQFKWAFPNYSSFDPSYTAVFDVTDATSGGKLKLYGDLKSSATTAEKTVGFTWSDPAVGPLDPDRTTNAVIVGSGYFPDIEWDIPARGSTVAGNALYLIDAATGSLLGNSSGTCSAISSGSGSSSGCAIIGDVNNGRKNALQADPTAAGQASSVIVEKAYLGDIDGNYWRFNFTPTGVITARKMLNVSNAQLQPIYASSALLFIGSAEVYMFFATGSDLLPANAPGGTGTFKLYGLRDVAPTSAATTKFTISLAATTNTAGLATGERPSTSPSVAGDIVFYTTTTESAAAPCAEFTGKLYAVTYTGGAAYDSALDINATLDKNESPVVAALAGRATAPFIVDQHLYLATIGAGGVNIEAFGDPEDFNNGVGQVGVRILSWREIR